MPDIRFAYNGKLVSPSSGKVIGNKALPPIAQRTLRFKFYDKTIDPTQWDNVWGINATWTRIKSGIYDWHCDSTEWAGKFPTFGASPGGNSVLDTYRYNNNGAWWSYLTRVDLDIIDSDLTGVTNVFQLFKVAHGVHHCSLKNTGSVQNWGNCFLNTNRGVRLESLEPLDMSSVDVTKFSYDPMFGFATNINSPIVLNLPNVTSLQRLFTGGNNMSSSTLTLNLSSAFTGATAIVLGNSTSFNEVIITGTTGMTSARYFNSPMVKKYTWTDWNTAGVDCTSMFYNCGQLTELSLPANAKVTNANSMFSGCTGLTSIPANLDLSAVTDTTSMFSGCTAIESGALSMYNYLSTKSIPVTSHTGTFTNCGSSAAQDAPIHAEMAQIPTSWGGTGA